MYMRELGTTLLRSRRAGSRVIATSLFLVLGTLALGQTNPAPANIPVAQTPSPAGAGTTPQQAAPAQTPAPSSQPAASQPSPSQPGSQSSSQAGQPISSQAPTQGPNGPPNAAGQAAGDQAQAPVAGENGGFVFRSEAKEVWLHATVVDEHNRLVTNLQKTDFTVFENNQPQQIRFFKQEDFPVAMGILIDNSGSMREKRDEVNKAALNLVRSSNPDDQVFVVNFNDEYYLDQEFTSDIKKLQAALEHVETRGGTALFDAIIASADYLMKSPLQRKVLFVVTDGEDDASQTSLEQAVTRLQQENGPTVYAIGLLGEEKVRKARRALELFADRTGGIAFFPPTLSEVDEISRSIAHDIRSQYTMTYAPSTPKSVPGYRTIHVDAHARPYKKLTVRTRTGYYPGQEKQGAGGVN